MGPFKKAIAAALMGFLVVLATGFGMPEEAAQGLAQQIIEMLLPALLGGIATGSAAFFPRNTG